MRLRWRPGKSVHTNHEVMFEVKRFKRSSQSRLTWPHPHTQLERDGSFPHWTLLLLSLCAEGIFQHAFYQQLPSTRKSEIHQQNQEAAVFLAPLVLSTCPPGCLRHCTPLLPGQSPNQEEIRKTLLGTQCAWSDNDSHPPMGFEK